MLRNFVEEEFYVALFSNDSLNYYANYTHSAFTNLLSKPCRFNDDWHVRLVEIGLNDFTPESSRLIKKRSIETFSTDSDSNEYDTDEFQLSFNCCRPKRKNKKKIKYLYKKDKMPFSKKKIIAMYKLTQNINLLFLHLYYIKLLTVLQKRRKFRKVFRTFKRMYHTTRF